MGVDSVLYVWGEKIPDEKLTQINRDFLEQFGEETLGHRNGGIQLQAWFDDVPDTALYYVDTDLARWFHHEERARTGWPTVKARIEFCRQHLPGYFLIHTNDSSNLEDFDHSGRIVTEELIRLNDEAYAKFEEEVGW